jgi:hypothetical protein
MIDNDVHTIGMSDIRQGHKIYLHEIEHPSYPLPFPLACLGSWLTENRAQSRLVPLEVTRAPRSEMAAPLLNPVRLVDRPAMLEFSQLNFHV